MIGAVGAMGGFLIPIAFSSPWVDDPLSATKGAFVVFTCFYVVCALVTFAVYLRKPAQGDEAGDGRGLTRDQDPLPLLLAPVRDGPRGPSHAGGAALAGVPRQRGSPVPQGLDGDRAARPPRAADLPARARPRDR